MCISPAVDWADIAVVNGSASSRGRSQSVGTPPYSSVDSHMLRVYIHALLYHKHMLLKTPLYPVAGTGNFVMILFCNLPFVQLPKVDYSWTTHLCTGNTFLL